MPWSSRLGVGRGVDKPTLYNFDLFRNLNWSLGEWRKKVEYAMACKRDEAPYKKKKKEEEEKKKLSVTRTM
jgi:hypothetical protein